MKMLLQSLLRQKILLAFFRKKACLLATKLKKGCLLLIGLWIVSPIKKHSFGAYLIQTGPYIWIPIKEGGGYTEIPGGQLRAMLVY
ncbi:MAG: hypothetical protein A2946_00785 [Candidatus Liptonbacteria bacterium RIFCSPLOWO2_01_FULL_53_13]|uniref:Uncharacterized protein n=1 Tax=Candidatus Liptonbacteria bacterium RIFCSPLOWO2_01_FULL_53_13 TaxID=1798651 RepID=A0A1G2CJF1_9BACT|nr:MAG: hypothetical protein A2946_00785 [Candidatus Liptonbacteria bacterium RIFCSPLOWO2_01_FULL_53_13]